MELPKRFIVVDDDNTNNLICKLTLRRIFPDAEIIIFRNPTDAIQYIENSYSNAQPFITTALFLDINMPIISGWEFLEIFNNYSFLIRQQFSIYILTASIDMDDQQKALSNLNVQGYLYKPLSHSIMQLHFCDT